MAKQDDGLGIVLRSILIAAGLSFSVGVIEVIIYYNFLIHTKYKTIIEGNGFYTLMLLLVVLSAIISAVIEKDKKQKLKAFLAGAFFALPGIVIYLIVSVITAIGIECMGKVICEM